MSKSTTPVPSHTTTPTSEPKASAFTRKIRRTADVRLVAPVLRSSSGDAAGDAAAQKTVIARSIPGLADVAVARPRSPRALPLQHQSDVARASRGEGAPGARQPTPDARNEPRSGARELSFEQALAGHENTRQRMTRTFSRSFSDVRIQPDSHRAAGSVQALTEGRTIHFARDRYRPGTRSGDWLLGHELAHVVQQNVRPARTLAFRSDARTDPDNHRSLESEADRAADAAVQGRRAVVALRVPMSRAQAFSGRRTVVPRSTRKNEREDEPGKPREKEDETDGKKRETAADTDGQVNDGQVNDGQVNDGQVNDGQVNDGQVNDSQKTDARAAGGDNDDAKGTGEIEESEKRAPATNARSGDASRVAVGSTSAGADVPATSEADESQAAPIQNAEASGSSGTSETGPKQSSDADATEQQEGPKAPKNPAEDPAFQAVVGQSRNMATEQRAHKDARTKAAQAQGAAKAPQNDIESQAKARQVAAMGKAPTPGFDRGAFKEALMKRITDAAPRTLEQADDFKGNNKLDGVKSGLKQTVGDQQEKSQGKLEAKAKEAPDKSGLTSKKSTPMPANKVGKKPRLAVAGAVPKKRTASEVEAPIAERSRALDERMADAKVTETQLANSNEPAFQSALDSKKKAQEHARTGPAAARAFEGQTLSQAGSAADAVTAEKLGAMHANRSQILGQVTSGQRGAKGKDEGARARIANELQQIYDRSKGDVENILAALDTDVDQAFESGARRAKRAFENDVERRIEAYKNKRYRDEDGDFRWVLWGKDKLLGLPEEANQVYLAARSSFIQDMDEVIDEVVGIIGDGLTRAKQRIANGKQEIADHVKKLPANLRAIGRQAATGIQQQFGQLEQSVDQKQSELIDTLTQKYTDTVKSVDARIEEMKAANTGLADVAMGGLMEVIKTIGDLRKMFQTVLAKVVDTVDKIIRDPIGFLGNLIAGIKLGFDNFSANIVTHLQAGFITWLTGALGPVGITIPQDVFSLKGIFSLVMQVLGLSWAYIRKKAVKLLGSEKLVAAMEKGVEIFKVLIAEGPGGLWNYVKEQFSDLKAMVMDQIKSMLITEVIKAGIKWILGLLSPASAFIKAAMAIYEIVTFFVERARQVMALVEAVVDSIAAIAAGNLAGAAKLVEDALARAIPIVIGFLASLLGISGLAKRVQGIITKIRARIDKAIDNLILKARKMFKGTGGKAGKAGKGQASRAGKVRLTRTPRMRGEKHTLYLVPGKTPRIDMASKRGLLSNKVGRTIGRLIALQKQDPQAVKSGQIDALKDIGAQAKKVQALADALGIDPRGDVDTLRAKKAKADPVAGSALLDRELDGLEQAISSYGDSFDQKDIESLSTTESRVTSQMSGGRPYMVTANPLTKRAPEGKKGDGGRSNTIKALKNGATDSITHLIKPDVLIRVHMLAGDGAFDLHGQDAPWNLVGGDARMNNMGGMQRAEKMAKDIIQQGGETKYKVVASYYNNNKPDSAKIKRAESSVDVAKEVVGYYFADKLDVTVGKKHVVASSHPLEDVVVGTKTISRADKMAAHLSETYEVDGTFSHKDVTSAMQWAPKTTRNVLAQLSKAGEIEPLTDEGYGDWKLLTKRP